MATQRTGTNSSRTDDSAKSGASKSDAGKSDAGKAKDGQTPIRIKKYANRRLYNTSTSSYVTLEHLAQMVKDGKEFVVNDAKTGEDITRAVLTQIIVEEESKGDQNMLPIGFLRQLISLYGDNMQWMVPKYLEYSLESFAENQERMRHYMQNTVSGMFPFNSIDDVSRKNLAMMEQAMKMFSPFPPVGGTAQSSRADKTESDEKAHTNQDADAGNANPFGEMQRRLDELQRQMEALGEMSKAISGKEGMGSGTGAGKTGKTDSSGKDEAT
jgi:polyhydroxyalkanoate synthesis repressor PhaR